MRGLIRIVCNSDLDVRDVETARAANYAMRREWCASHPEQYPDKAKDRFARLYAFLHSGKMQVRVLPREQFGLVHGKAGVITLADGHKTCFMGSANETYDAWKLHYELVWEDDTPEAVQWVQEEFDALWHSPFAVPLADFVVEDVGRLAQRMVVPSVEVWRDEPEPAAPLIETPVYRQEYGLWEHQKYFVTLAFEAHKGAHSARLILADMVGLGKTLQLAMAGMLLEQRKGRIQRIGQLRDTVFVYNMRYKESVEDRVHDLLSERLAGLYALFGQLPDVLEDVWIDVALGQIEHAKATIDAVPKQHPFELKYHSLTKVPWETCTQVLDTVDQKTHLLRGWKEPG